MGVWKMMIFFSFLFVFWRAKTVKKFGISSVNQQMLLIQYVSALIPEILS